MAIDTSLSPVITVQGLADYLRVHPSTVYRLVKQGLLPAFKVGSDWRFNCEDIRRWRLAQTSQSRALAGLPDQTNESVTPAGTNDEADGGRRGGTSSAGRRGRFGANL